MVNRNNPLVAVRRLCMALPQVTERLSHGAPTWFIRDKKTFVMYLDNHHDDGRVAIWCAAPVGVQGTLVDEEPNRFFVPPYVGGRGWLGVRLDRDLDPQEMAGIIDDAYRTVAPKRLIAELGGRRSTPRACGLEPGGDEAVEGDGFLQLKT